MNARVESPFDVSLRDALSLARDCVPRWLVQLQAELQQREAAANHLHEKQACAQARLLLVGCRDRLAERFQAALFEGVHAAMALGYGASTPGGGPVRKSSAVGLDDLELMDHDQVQATVELARLQQVIKMAADDELMGLCALFSGAHGLPAVRQEANPFRPEVVVDALMQALRQLHVDEVSRARWLHAGALPLGQELKRFYRELGERLQRDGIRPAGYVVVPVAVAPRAGAAAATSRADAGLANDGSAGSAVLTLDHLHQLLVGNLDSGGAAVSDQGASGSGNAMVRTLAAEVVTLMLRTIAADTRLLQPVRDMVQQLKPALMHLARSDPRFFADRHNPARRLLDTVTVRSLAFRSEQDNGFAAYADRVHEAVRDLQSLTVGLPDRIADHLRRLEAMESAGQPRGQGLAMQTLVKVEQRQLLAARVAEEVHARNDFARAPGLVRRFLLGPWAQVVAHARLSVPGDPVQEPGDVQAQRYMDILPDLLWSCQLSQASQNRPRLVRVIPALLRTLREGLDAIDYPRAQAESFFQALMGLHEAAYKTQRPVEATGPSVPAQQTGLPSEPWMQYGEARDSGFLDAVHLENDFVDTEPLARELPNETAGLTVGAWIELVQDDRVQRCQLRWASPHGTMFLFAAADGRSISLTRRGLERLTAVGRVRVISNQGVVDEALAAVARQAWINSGKL
jgi:hypothetical protein